MRLLFVVHRLEKVVVRLPADGAGSGLSTAIAKSGFPAAAAGSESLRYGRRWRSIDRATALEGLLRAAELLF